MGNGMMRAIQKRKRAAGAEVVEVPIPKPSSHQVLVRVKATSICGTDLHIFRWDAWASHRIKPPLIFGHEFAGEVVEVGSQVEHIAVGDRVSAETHIPCGGCFQCRTGKMHICQQVEILGVDRDGCFAEYIAVPDICCIKNDVEMPWEIASMQEPFGNATYAVSESQVSGKSVAIFGDGPIGIFAVAIARAYGATKLFACGMQPYRLELMKRYEPDYVINVTEEQTRDVIREMTHGAGVDVVVEMSGSERAIHDGLAVVKNGGTFTAFGIPSSPIRLELAEEVIFKGIEIKAIVGRKMFQTWYEAANLLTSGRVDVRPIITHRLPLTLIDEAMAMLSAERVQAGKIVLKP